MAIGRVCSRFGYGYPIPSISTGWFGVLWPLLLWRLQWREAVANSTEKELVQNQGTTEAEQAVIAKDDSGLFVSWDSESIDRNCSRGWDDAKRFCFIATTQNKYLESLSLLLLVWVVCLMMSLTLPQSSKADWNPIRGIQSVEIGPWGPSEFKEQAEDKK